MDGGVSGPKDDRPLGMWMLRGTAHTPKRATHMVMVLFDSGRAACAYAAENGISGARVFKRYEPSDQADCTCLREFQADCTCLREFGHSQIKVPLGWHHSDCDVTLRALDQEERMERELPKYQSHKVVSAIKIGGWKPAGVTNAVLITPADPGISEFYTGEQWGDRVPAEVREALVPADYGYYVRYSDGFESWSPSKAFEEGYKPAPDHGPAQKEALHQALPVKGYSAQNSTATDAVNANKVLEEQCLRQLDQLGADVRLEPDQRCLSLARTKLQEAFMWANRAVFKPKRIDL